MGFNFAALLAGKYPNSTPMPTDTPKLTATAMGVGVAEKLCAFVMLIPSAFAQSMTAFVAQNVGARRMDRAGRALLCGIGLSLAVSIVVFWGVFFHGDLLSGIFAEDEAVILASAEYLKAYAIDCLLTSFLFSLIGYFNGCGRTVFTMLQGLTGAFCVRLPVAFFDSGLGGISVLRELVRTLPMENYLYFGDSLHAPYGTKTPEEVTQLSLQAAQKLLAQGAKALVVACNTATSAAIRTLRKTYPALAIVGTEPAIKPAAERHPGGRILMLATAMTVQEEKFQRLKAQYDEQAQIIPIACSGLMEYVEQGILRGPEVEGYLLDKLEPYLKVPIDAVVLGCTHYPFLRGAIRRIVGRRPEIIDGSFGIAKQLQRRLEEQQLLNPGPDAGSVSFQNSLDEPEMLELMQALFSYEDETP